MKVLYYAVCRNIKVFFRDKGTFFVALIAPLILLVLYILFLGDVYKESFVTCFPADYAPAGKLLGGLVGGYLLSSLLSVSCVTVAFTANMVMVQDRLTGAAHDFAITPVRPAILYLAYYIATEAVTFSICLVATFAGFIYLACVGWYLSVGTVFAIIGAVLLLSLFGTALSSIVCKLIKNHGGMTVVSTIMSSIYGFFAGAYMPIGSLSPVFVNIISCLPGTYGTVLLRNLCLNDCFTQMQASGYDAQSLAYCRQGFDCDFSFFSTPVPPWACVLILILSTLLLITLYITLHFTAPKRHSKKLKANT
jgi:multidrug/hemolysin transport system permease protein